MSELYMSHETDPCHRHTTEADMVWPRHSARQPLRNSHARRHRWSSSAMAATQELDRHRHRMDKRYHARHLGEGHR